MSCRAALRKLETRGALRLPAARGFPGGAGKRRVGTDPLQALGAVEASITIVAAHTQFQAVL